MSGMEVSFEVKGKTLFAEVLHALPQVGVVVGYTPNGSKIIDFYNIGSVMLVKTPGVSVKAVCHLLEILV